MIQLKYVVDVHTMLKKGDEIKSEDFSFTFDDPNKNNAANRLDAIQKMKDLFSFFRDEAGGDFDSPLGAELKGYQNFGAWSISLSYVETGIDPLPIFGVEEYETNLDEMEFEYNRYLKDQLDSVEVDGRNIPNQEVDWFLSEM